MKEDIIELLKNEKPNKNLKQRNKEFIKVKDIKEKRIIHRDVKEKFLHAIMFIMSLGCIAIK